MTYVGIDGFGRIRRNVPRAAWDKLGIRIAAGNDLTDSHTLAHLLKHDSTLGSFGPVVTSSQDTLSVDGTTIRVFSEKTPATFLGSMRTWISSSNQRGDSPNALEPKRPKGRLFQPWMVN